MTSSIKRKLSSYEMHCSKSEGVINLLQCPAREKFIVYHDQRSHSVTVEFTAVNGNVMAPVLAVLFVTWTCVILHCLTLVTAQVEDWPPYAVDEAVCARKTNPIMPQRDVSALSVRKLVSGKSGHVTTTRF